MRLALKVYFRKQHINGLHNIPKGGPFIIVANHPSSFLDPVSIAILINQKINFLAKATLFNNKIAAKLLYKLNLVPIYRAQDNPSKLRENKSVFEACYKKLGDNGIIMIFPEGTSENERRLRSIKTGAARIALGTAKENNYGLNIKILPVGLNYTKSSKFRSELSIEFGEPLDTNDFIEDYQKNETATARHLTLKIEENIKRLIINIDKQEHDELVDKLEKIYKTELAPNSNLPTEVSQEIVKAIGQFQQHNSTVFNDTKFKIDNYFEKLSQANISDKNISLEHENSSLFVSTIKSVLKIVVGFPIWIIGIIHSYIPYRLTRTIALIITKDEAFYGALLMSLGTILFTLFYGLFMFLSWILFQDPFITLIYSLCLPLFGLFTIYYARFSRKFYYNWKFLSKFYSKNEMISELIIERKKITSELELLRNDLEK